jgi:ketosteroid isomerase-like protein
MDDLTAELTVFMASYERATNHHDIARVAAMIAADATYWFTDGSFRGRPEIMEAIARTFATIQDEIYWIRDLEWVCVGQETAACRYRFGWTGVVGGRGRAGQGRGTNVIVRRDGAWQMLHEHLSA